jgi:hypothetical protein
LSRTRGVLCELWDVDSDWHLDLFALRLQPPQITITGSSLALAASCELLLHSVDLLLVICLLCETSFSHCLCSFFWSVCSVGCHSTAVQASSPDLLISFCVLCRSLRAPSLFCFPPDLCVLWANRLTLEACFSPN